MRKNDVMFIKSSFLNIKTIFNVIKYKLFI